MAKLCSRAGHRLPAIRPAGQFLFPGTLGHHLGEARHVPGEAVLLLAVAARIGEQLLLAGSMSWLGAAASW